MSNKLLHVKRWIDQHHQKNRSPSFERARGSSSTLSNLYQMRLENAQLVAVCASSCPSLFVVDTSETIVCPITRPELSIESFIKQTNLENHEIESGLVTSSWLQPIRKNSQIGSFSRDQAEHLKIETTTQL